ncbi:MAG: response regulator [Chloroflexota bacterium]
MTTKKQAWIVDDDEEMCRAVQLMLKLLDLESRYYLSPRTAGQALLEGETPDVLILDINMPDVSGMDFLEFLRKHSDYANLPVVMLSTEAADVQVDLALEMGADAYVTKPVSLEEMSAAIQRALRVHGKI